MGSAVNLQGNLIAGPPKSSGTTFPTGFVNVQFELTPPNKDASVQVYQQLNLASADAYATLPGVGTTVTKGTFLYLRTTAKMMVRLTINKDDNTQEVSVLYVQGVHVLELPSQNYLELLEAQGVGVIEYFASGNL